jgi:quercetin dioxygenase-like cupin family protein
MAIGCPITRLAGEADTGGAFDLVVSKMRKGTEPPPHVHSREHEFFHILAGKLKVYIQRPI